MRINRYLSQQYFRSCLKVCTIGLFALGLAVAPTSGSWHFFGTPTARAVSATISGIVYNTTETAALATSQNMKLRTSAGVTATTTSTVTTGAFSFTGVSVSDGDVITVWLTGATKGTLVFKYGASCTGYTDCTGLKLYQSRLAVASYNGTSIANSDLGNCDDDSNCATVAGESGTGADGALSVKGTSYTDDVRTALTAGTTGRTTTSLTVASNTGFGMNDEVLIMQMSGTASGSYETATVQSVSGGTTINLTAAVENSYTVPSSPTPGIAQVIRVPNYTDVTVDAQNTLTAHAWDGATGGVLFFRASGAVSISGTITATGLGFNGTNGGGGGAGSAGGTAVTGGNGDVPTASCANTTRDRNGVGGTAGHAGGNGLGVSGGPYGAGGSNTNCGASGTYGYYGGNGSGGGKGSSVGGTAGTAGSAGAGPSGGATAGAAGTNTSRVAMDRIIMGGQGGGGTGGMGGGGGGGGASGGGAVPPTGSSGTFYNGKNGLAGDTGTTGGTAGDGGAGGGIVIIKAQSITVNAGGAVSSAGLAGGAGGAGGKGGNGGAGGDGGDCTSNGTMALNSAGGAGGGGGGGHGGNGGVGGGGGAGGSIFLGAETVSLGTNLVTAAAGGAGTAGAAGGASTGGARAVSGYCTYGHDVYSSAGGNGTAGSAGGAGTAGTVGKIRVVAAADPSVTTSPAASHAGGFLSSAAAPGFTANANAVALSTGNTKIVVASGTTYAPGGDITAAQLEIAGTYTAGSETITLSGTGIWGGSCTSDTAPAFCSTGTFNAGTSKVVFTGTAAQSPFYGSTNHQPTFYDVEIQGTYSGGPSSTLTISHNLNVPQGATFNGTSGSAITMSNGSSITCAGTCAFYSLVIDGAVSTTGNWTSNAGGVAVNTGGSFTAADTVTFVGDIDTNGTGDATFNNVVNNGTMLCYSTGNKPTINGTLTMNVDSICYTGLTMGNGSSIVGTGQISLPYLTIDGTVTASAPILLYCSSSCGNLTVNAGASFTHTGTFTADYNGSINNTAGGALSFNNLAYTQLSSTTTVNGDMTVGGILSLVAGKTVTQASGTTTMTHGSSISNSGTALTFYNLNIPANATVIANTNFSVASSVQFGSGSTFTPSSGTVTLKTGADIENSGGTVTFSGLTVDTNAPVAASGSFNVAGNLTVNSGGTLTPAATNVVGGAGTLTGSGTVKVTRATGTTDFAGQFPITNKTLSGLTVDFSGTAQGVDSLTYGTLQFSGTNATSVTATAKNLTVPTGGTFTPSAGTVTISDAGLITGTGTLTTQNVTLANNASVSGTLGVTGTLTVPSGGFLEPNLAATRISGAGTITGGGTIYVVENTAGTAAGGDLVKQYPITTVDLPNLKVIFVTSGCTIGNLTFHDLQLNASCNDAGTLSFTVNGTLTMKTAVFFPMNAGAVLTLAGATVSLEGTSQLYYPSINVTGNVSVGGAGTFLGNNSVTRVQVPAGASLTVTVPTSLVFAQPFEFANDGTMTLSTITNATNSPTASVSGPFYITGVYNNLKTTGDVYTGTMILQDGATIYDRATAGSTFPNITVADGASVTSSGSYPVSGTLSVGTGATLTPTATSVISGTGTLTGTGTVKVIRATGTNDFAGQYSISNKTLSGLTVDFAGNGSDIDDTTYGNLKVSGSVTAGTSPVVNGQLLVTGTLTPSAGSVSFGNGGSVENSGTLTFYNADIPAGITAMTTGTIGTGNLLKVDGTLTPVATSVLSGNGTLSGSGKIKVTRINGTAPLTEQYTISNKDYSSLTVSYTGSGTQAMTPMTYKNLDVDQPNVTGVASVSGNFLSVYVVGNASTKIEMTGSDWSISGFPVFNKFSVDTTPTVQPTANFSIAQNGTLSVETGATLQPTSGTLTLYPGVSFSGSGTLAPYSLWLTGSGTTTLPANITVANALTIGNGHTLNLGTGTLTLTAQNPTVTNNGSISGASGTIEYAPVGTSGTTIPATTFYGHLKLNKASNTFTVSQGTLSVGELNVAAGTLDMASNAVAARVASISISGTLNAPTPSGSLTVSGEWTNNGTFNHGNGTVTFEPSGDSAVIQGSVETDFYNLRMIQPGKALKIKTGILFDVDGALDISGLSGNPAFLESDTPGQTFTLALASPATLDYVQLKDVACHASTATLTLGEHGDTRGNVGECVVRIQRGGGGSAFAPAGGSSGGGTPTGGGTDVGGGVSGGGAANTGFLSPSATGHTYNQWTNPTNAYSSNNQYAVGSENTNQDFGTFNISVPGGSTINGISVSIEYQDPFMECISMGCAIDTYLSYDNGAHWTEAKTYWDLGNPTDQTQTVGGVSDTWGRSWSVSEMGNNSFLVRITSGYNGDPFGQPHTLYVDHVQVKVNYTAPGTGGGAAQESPTPTPAPPTGGGENEGGGDGAAP